MYVGSKECADNGIYADAFLSAGRINTLRLRKDLFAQISHENTLFIDLDLEENRLQTHPLYDGFCLMRGNFAGCDLSLL